MFFASVFTKETDTLSEYHTPIENTIDSMSFTINKVKVTLKELNPFKYAHIDRLQPRILKELSEELTTPLSTILAK